MALAEKTGFRNFSTHISIKLLTSRGSYFYVASSKTAGSIGINPENFLKFKLVGNSPLVPKMSPLVVLPFPNSK